MKLRFLLFMTVFITGYGFNSKASAFVTSDNFNDISQIETNLSFTPYQSTDYLVSTRGINTSCLVGTTLGECDVSSTGGAIYRIPIAVPDGIKDVKPNITVSYDSQTGNGILGYGWGLNAISVISRVGKNYYNDGVMEAPTLTNSDNLMLDGQRLVLTSGSNLLTSSYYATEIEAYNEIRYVAGDCFKVYTPDGYIYEYGSTSNSRVTSQTGAATLYWLLSKVTDQYGNYMLYSYTKLSTEFYLSSISYTGNEAAGVLPTRKVEFSYTGRSDVSTKYFVGSEMRSSVLLSKIRATVNGNTFREYRFNYTYSGLYSKLAQVQEYGSDGTCYNPTTIEWSCVGGPKINKVNEVTIPDTRKAWNMPIFADFDGDGRMDMLVLPTKKAGQDNWAATDVATLYLSKVTNGVVSYEKHSTLSLSGKISLHTGDLNGDGKRDIILVRRETFFHYEYYINNGSSFTKTVEFQTRGPYFDNKDALVADFNGDGKDEVLTYSDRLLYNDKGVQIASAQDSIFWKNKYISYFPNNIHMIDFNGNGKCEILNLGSDGGEVWELDGAVFRKLRNFSRTDIKHDNFVHFGDFNGDGLTDIYVQNLYTPDRNTLYLSTGTSFVVKNLNGRDIESPVATADINGDGITDIIHGTTVSGKFVIKTGVFKGSDFVTTNRYETGLASTLIQSANINIAIGDFTGDGKAEYCISDVKSYNKLHLISLADNEQLHTTKITNGMDFSTSFGYTSLNNLDAYKMTGTSLSFPVCKTNGSMKVVAKMTSNEHTPAIDKDFYYEDLFYHRQGKGFLGFYKTKVKDNVDNLFITTNNTINSTYYYSYIRRQEVSSERETGTLLSLLENTYGTTVYANKRIFPYKSKEVFTDYLYGTQKTSSYSAYLNGEPMNMDIQYGTDLKETINIRTTNNTSTVRLLNLPIQIVKKQTTSRGAWTDRTICSYDSKGRLTENINYTNDGNKKVSTEAYTYTPVGNVLKKTFIPYESPNELTHDYKYSSEHNLIEESDYKFRVTKYSYDNLGRCTEKKMQPSYQTEKYSYDAMGRLATVISPSGNKAYSYSWDDQNNFLYNLEEVNSGVKTITYYSKTDGSIKRTKTLQATEQWIMIDWTYNNRGQLVRQIIPRILGRPLSTDDSVSNRISVSFDYGYDKYGRLIKKEEPTGKTQHWEYTFGQNKVKETIYGITKTKNYDAADRLVSVTDAGGDIEYFLRPDGADNFVKTAGKYTEVLYDDYGRVFRKFDPCIFDENYGYDAAGNIKSKSYASTMPVYREYNDINDVVKESVGNRIVDVIYDNHGYYKIDIVRLNGKSEGSVYYNYDSNDRIAASADYITGNDKYYKKYRYDNEGRIISNSYGAGVGGEPQVRPQATIDYFYENGSLRTIKMDTTTIWHLERENEYLKPISISATIGTGGKMKWDSNYGVQGVLVGLTFQSYDSNNVQKLNRSYSYGYNNADGNLISSKVGTLTEEYTYDQLDRLTGYGSSRVTYDNKGNIISKSDVGDYSYPSNQIYCVNSITPYTGSAIKSRDQRIYYNDYLKPDSIVENGYKASFYYNSLGDRYKMEVRKNGVIQYTRYYAGGDYERLVTPTSTKDIFYLAGDYYSATAVLVCENEAKNLYYIGRDRMGSIVSVVNATTGNEVAQYSYDPWGRMRNPSNNQVYNIDEEPALFLGRGYTGHEHLPMFGLINMNARLYDPLLGRFLNADPELQMPDFTQNYNRYSYCLNNPLKYTDESGEMFVSLFRMAKGSYRFFFKGFNAKDLYYPYYQAWKILANGAKIDYGWLKGDISQIYSRYTKELPQTLLGNLWSHCRNNLGKVDKVRYFKGATYVIHDNSSKYRGVTLGSYVNMNIKEKYSKEIYEPNGKFTVVNDGMMMHEYGHYIQSQKNGLKYLIKVGVPSLLTATLFGKVPSSDNPNVSVHGMMYYERNANKRAKKYFEEMGVLWDENKYPFKK